MSSLGRFFTVCSMLLLSAISVAEESIETAIKLRQQALNSNQGWDLVASLTTEVGPRLAGTAADHAAVSWAKKQLLDSPVAFDRVWLEPVSFLLWQRHHEHGRIVSPYPQPLLISALGYSGSTDGEITGEVISYRDLKSFKQATAEQVKGKIVFVNEAMERHREGKGYGDTVIVRYEAALLAKELGAKAVLIRSLATGNHRFPHTGVGRQVDQPLPAAALSIADAEQLQRVLDKGKPVTVALDISVSEQPSGHSWNVIAQINGRQHPEDIVLIGAHLDSWDLGTGAVDDGAGVAITMAAAQLIAQLPQRPKRSVRLILFANEEQGLWGAKAYAKAHNDELDKHIMVSESDFGAGQVWRLDTANKHLMSVALPILKPLGVAEGAAATSGGPDMKPLFEAGVPVFRLKQEGSDYFDYHHSADDTLDKISAADLKQNIAAWSVVTYLAAEIDVDKTAIVGK
jgi:carboxypeptidase Q